MDDRNLALELVRVTETAALASAKFMSRGDKNGADGAAVEGMRMAFESVNIRGEIVIGEGELDEAPMLYVGEKVGSGFGPSFDIAVDPLDGTSLIAKGLPNAIAVIAMAIGKGKKIPTIGIKSVPSPNPEKKVSNDAKSVTLPIKIISIHIPLYFHNLILS